MSWSGFVKSINRAGTTLMQKAGAVEKTVDEEFEEEKRRFKSLESNLDKLHTETRGYLDSITALTNSQRRIAELISIAMVDQPQQQQSAEKYNQVIQNLENEALAELETNVKSTNLDPLGRMIAHFPMINDTIKRRQNKLLDFDAARTKAHKLLQKPSEDPIKVSKAEMAAKEAQEVYEAINNQLITEIPRLVDSRLDLLDPSFEALVKSQLQYAAQASETFDNIHAFLPGANKAPNQLDADIEDILLQMRDLTICGLV
ncbi:BAR-domain-containing protein [Neoconidiobolus thromboides FSU 785]|nr:BAR-domain-containing protein [Neoconidiobolus thromboides FSU 785]